MLRISNRICATISKGPFVTHGGKNRHNTLIGKLHNATIAKTGVIKYKFCFGRIYKNRVAGFECKRAALGTGKYYIGNIDTGIAVGVCYVTINCCWKNRCTIIVIPCVGTNETSFYIHGNAVGLATIAGIGCKRSNRPTNTNEF